MSTSERLIHIRRDHERGVSAFHPDDVGLLLHLLDDRRRLDAAREAVIEAAREVIAYSTHRVGAQMTAAAVGSLGELLSTLDALDAAESEER